jgi:hypothetical protein
MKWRASSLDFMHCLQAGITLHFRILDQNGERIVGHAVEQLGLLAQVHVLQSGKVHNNVAKMPKQVFETHQNFLLQLLLQLNRGFGTPVCRAQNAAGEKDLKNMEE